MSTAVRSFLLLGQIDANLLCRPRHPPRINDTFPISLKARVAGLAELIVVAGDYVSDWAFG